MSSCLIDKDDAANFVKAQVLLINNMLKKSNVDLIYIEGYLDALQVFVVEFGLKIKLPELEIQECMPSWISPDVELIEGDGRYLLGELLE